MKLALVGGHMAPALGLLTALPASVKAFYIGRKHVFEGDRGVSLEEQTVTRLGIPFFPLQAGRVQRVLTKHTLPSLLKVPVGFFQAYTILKREKPDAVVGFGGYLSVPVGLAAWILHIPLVIHESALEAGLANKFLAPFAKKICISWEQSRAFFPPRKTILTGDPMLPFHQKVHDISVPSGKERLPFVMVSGGSGGAHGVNMLIASILPTLLEKASVLHIAGDAQAFNDYKILQEKRNILPQKLQERYRIVKFIDPLEINSIFAKAELVVGRSGINTVATMLLLHKKMVCIPLPYGQKNEQLANAQLLEKEGLAAIVNQYTVSPEELFQCIADMLKKKILHKTEQGIVQNAGEKLYQEVEGCVKNSRKDE